MEPNIFDYIKRAKDGDKQAEEYIIQHNTGLVWSIVKKFSNRGYEADDLFQTGCVGLLKAVRKFDTSFDVQFSTYAVPMILGEIKRFIRDDGIIKVSRSLKQLSAKAYAVREQLNKTTGREPTLAEIAGQLEVSTEEVVMALDACSPPKSIHESVGDEGHEFMEKIDSGDSLEEAVIDRISISDALRSFKPRERQIIVLRYFTQKTQSQVAQILGISQVQVSRIEKKVLLEMRDKIRIQG